MSRGLVAELPEPGCITFCLGLAPHRGLVRIFKRTWDALIRTHGGQGLLPAFSAPPLPRIASPSIPLSSAWSAPGVSLALEDAIGRVAAELICPYPPGIPLVVPGEKLDRPRIDWLVQEQSFWPDQIENQIKVVAE